MTIRKIFGKAHLWLGLASGLVVFVVSITGCLYVFEEEIRDLTQAERRFVPVGSKVLALARLVEGVRRQYPGETIRQMRTYSAPDRAYFVFFEKGRAVSVNPYTGGLSKPYDREDWLGVTEHLHTSLLLGETGKWLIKANILIFLVMLISGIMLWWPQNMARLRQSFKVKWDASFKRVNYDFHNVFGFYSSWILLVIVLTGMWWSFDWVKRTVYFATGSAYVKPKPVQSDTARAGTAAGLSPTDAYQLATQRYPGFDEVHLDFPNKPTDAIRLRLNYPYDWYRKRNHLYFDQYTGTLLKAELFADFSAGDKAKHANYDLHTGRMFGMPGKIVAFLVSLFAASLPVTGFLVWWGKRRKSAPVRRRAVTGVGLPAPDKPRPAFKPRATAKA